MMSKRPAFRIKTVFAIILYVITIICACTVNGRVAVRLDDIIAVSSGRTERQLQNEIFRGIEDYKKAFREAQYEEGLKYLKEVLEDINKAYLVYQDKYGSYRSSTFFTPRKIDRENLDSRYLTLADLYVQCLIDGIIYQLVNGNLSGYYNWFENLTAPSSLKSHANSHSEKEKKLVEACLRAAELYFLENRIKDSILILEVLKKELESLISKTKELNLYRPYIDINLCTYYLSSGDLSNAENLIKKTVSYENDNIMKMSALLLLSRIKARRMEPHFSVLYLQKAFNILKLEPTQDNLVVFLGGLDSKIIEKYLVPPQWFLKELARLAKDSNTNHFLSKKMHFVNGSPYIRAAEIFQKAGNYGDRDVCLSIFENNIAYKIEQFDDLAAYIHILAICKQWNRIFTTVWPQLDKIEYIRQLSDDTYSAETLLNLADVYKGVALSFALSESQSYQTLLQNKWPTILVNRTYNKEQIIFRLIQLAKRTASDDSKIDSKTASRSAEKLKQELKRQKLRKAKLFSAVLAGDKTEAELNKLQDTGFKAWQGLQRQNILESKGDLSKNLSERIARNEILNLDEDAAIIEYAVIEDVVLVSILKHDKLKIFPLHINYTFIANQIYSFYSDCSTLKKQKKASTALQLFNTLINSLPVDISNVKTLYIAPDKAISRVPFSLLFDFADKRYAAGKDIVYLPTLAYIRPTVTNLLEKDQRTIALMGDPLPLDVHNAIAYGKKDSANMVSALRDITISTKSENPDNTKNILAGIANQEISYGLLHRIPFTKKEIMSIEHIAGHALWQTKVLLADEFTKNNVVDLLTTKPNYIHFATHAIISYEIPYIMEPSLLVSAFDRPIDHFFRASEIERLDLTGTKLVVLSACKTGLDASEDFAGVSGLAKPFLKAGVKNVILTLWSIDDEATSFFMKLFYDSLLSGKTIKSSIAIAKERMLNTEQFHDPYYWAGFVLYGTGS